MEDVDLLVIKNLSVKHFIHKYSFDLAVVEIMANGINGWIPLFQGPIDATLIQRDGIVLGLYGTKSFTIVCTHSVCRCLAA